uniref:Uncharacterized protein n=1 Tax=Cucumis melo TaxID=3656 RepID=A0A9I9DHE9_CUCME
MELGFDRGAFSFERRLWFSRGFAALDPSVSRARRRSRQWISEMGISQLVR